MGIDWGSQTMCLLLFSCRRSWCAWRCVCCRVRSGIEILSCESHSFDIVFFLSQTYLWPALEEVTERVWDNCRSLYFLLYGLWTMFSDALFQFLVLEPSCSILFLCGKFGLTCLVKTSIHESIWFFIIFSLKPSEMLFSFSRVEMRSLLEL